MERPELAIFRAPVIHSKHGPAKPSDLADPIPMPFQTTFNDPFSLYSYYLSQLMVAQRAAVTAAAVSAFYPPVYDPQTAAVFLSQNANLGFSPEKIEKSNQNWNPKQVTKMNSKNSWINYYEKSSKSVESSASINESKTVIDANNNSTVIETSTQSASSSSSPSLPSASNSDVWPNMKLENIESENPLLCAICGDKSSGLHYGMQTCEGCKGFFKRTVQNKRVYTCVGGNGKCPITKELRNRCQFCRFQKCLQEGLVIQAVREDRMPGGRNGSAIYSLYKHRKNNKKSSIHGQNSSSSSSSTTTPSPPQADWKPPPTLGITSSLTNLFQTPTISMPIPNKNLIQKLVEIDKLEDLMDLKGLTTSEPSHLTPVEKLGLIGDEIVAKLVEWTKKLPFYSELPISVHTQLLTQKWAELVLLSCCFFATEQKISTINNGPSFDNADHNLRLLQKRLSMMMGKPISFENITNEAGDLIQQITKLMASFNKLQISMETYVCLKAITLLHLIKSEEADDDNLKKVALIQDQFVKVLQIHLSQSETSPRLSDIFSWLPNLHTTSTQLLQSKMFYLPFLLCREPSLKVEISNH